MTQAAVDEHPTSVSEAPNWNQIPFPVGCARCGEDLRGLTEPVRGACGYAFDWAQAVPVEELNCLKCGYSLLALESDRCPECGTEVVWDRILEAIAQRRFNLFEHRYRDAAVRSALASCRSALRPGRHWRKLDLHDIPNRSAILILAGASLFVYAIAFPLFDSLIRWLASNNWVLSWRYPFRGPPFRSSRNLLQSFVNSISNPEIQEFVFMGLAWSGLTLGGLMIFRQSMRRCKIRTEHVLRVWTYSIPLVLPMALLVLYACLTCLFAVKTLTPIRVSRGLYPLLYIIIPAIMLLHATWSCRQGYRHYLKMPHSLGVALAVQVIAFLAISTAAIFIAPNGWCVRIVGTMLEEFDWI